MFTRAIVCPPSPSFLQGLTTVDMGLPDLPIALRQHQAYCLALEACGLAITKLPPDERFPDSTFVEDTAVLAGRSAILTRPGAPSREGEIEAMRPVLAQHYAELSAITAPGTLDGGDICEAGSHFFLGISDRTNEEGVHQLGRILAREGFTSTPVDIRGVPGILHLKSGIAWLGDRRLAVIDSLARRTEFQGWELVRVPAGEEYAANCILINGRILIADGFPAFETAMRPLGNPVISLDMSEFRKLDGGLSCLSLRF